ncbi:MAG: type II toxin-antitoxin system RelE/ParE family toxin [Burkholderiales bacterium]
MTYSLHPGAVHDIANAMNFYREQAGSVVSGYFLEEFERATTLLVEHPDLGTPTTKGRRTFPLKVFPYLIVYRNLQSNIRILIDRHHHRKPDHAGSRQ